MHAPLEYIPVLLILLYVPFVCISDWRSRTFNVMYYIPLILINAPLLYLYLAESPARNYYFLGLTILLCLVTFALALIKSIGGGDFWLITLMMITVPYNPFITIRKFFPLDFFYTLMITACYLPLVIYVYHIHKKDKLPFKQMLTQFPGDFPYTIPISFAFIATLIMEIVLFP